MSNRVISYHPRLDAAPEAELEVLARVYSFLIQTLENRKATTSVGFAYNKGGNSEQSKGPSATDRREE